MTGGAATACRRAVTRPPGDSGHGDFAAAGSWQPGRRPPARMATRRGRQLPAAALDPPDLGEHELEPISVPAQIVALVLGIEPSWMAEGF